MNIAFFSAQSYDIEYFNANNQTHHISFLHHQLNEQTAILAKNCTAICVFVNDVVNKEVISILANQGIKLIALRCAGYNNVDVLAAKENNITIVRVPAYSPHAVAEHALALILTLNRKTHKAYNRVRDGNFALDKLIGFDLYKKVVGVVGTGKIGETFCKIMVGLGCQVIAYDVVENKNVIDMGVQYTSLQNLWQQSDIVSLHCPLNPQTKYLINEDSLALMKKGAMLINTSRGALINTKDAISALKKQHLGYLGIDVYEQEDKLFFKDFSETVIQDETILRLQSFPNVLITAHQAFFTHEAMTEIAQTTLQNINLFDQGAFLPNKVG